MEVEYTVPEHFRGAEGVVHGGIQATLLDEVMGLAVHTTLAKEEHKVVTAELNVRYRKVTPTEVPLVIRASADARRRAEPVPYRPRSPTQSGDVLTEADGRWRTAELSVSSASRGCAAIAERVPRPSSSNGISGSAPCPIGTTIADRRPRAR